MKEALLINEMTTNNSDCGVVEDFKAHLIEFEIVESPQAHENEKGQR